MQNTYGFGGLAGWIQREYGFGSPHEWVRSMAKGLRARSNQIAPPIDPNAILRECNIQIQFVPELDVEGRLVCGERGFVVLLNERLRRYGARARFTVAHELGHTLFYDQSPSKPRRWVPRHFNNAFEEHLCSSFAGELLIPFDYLSGVADGFQRKTEAEKTAILTEVATKCLVAREVAACHLVRTLGWWKSILIFTAEAGKAGLGDNTDRARRIIWSWHPPEFDGSLYIPGSRGAYPKIKVKELQRIAADAAHAPNSQSVRSKLLRIGNMSTVLDRVVGAETEVFAVGCSRPLPQGSLFSSAQDTSRREVLLVIPLARRHAAA